MTPEEEAAIEGIERRAKKCLFGPDGKLRVIDDLLVLNTLDHIFRPVSPAEQVNPRAGLDFVPWCGELYVYDALVAKGFINKAKSGNYFYDRIVRNAAVLLLAATKGISDDKLRIYAINSLSGNNPDIKIDRRATRNMFRDHVIRRWLMLPLVRAGWKPTRNQLTDAECASSIVSKALARVGIDLAEKRLGEI